MNPPAIASTPSVSPGPESIETEAQQRHGSHDSSADGDRQR
jgi:hypothetical protein